MSSDKRSVWPFDVDDGLVREPIARGEGTPLQVRIQRSAGGLPEALATRLDALAVLAAGSPEMLLPVRREATGAVVIDWGHRLPLDVLAKSAEAREVSPDAVARAVVAVCAQAARALT